MLNHIKKIVLSENGFKGLKITYLVEEQKDGFPFLTPTVSQPKYPIHLGLEKKFMELREHLLNVCEICQNPRDDDEFKYNVNDTEITGLEMSSDWFKIVGIKKIGDKSITLKTYEVEEPDYYRFSEVMAIIKEIREETREYVAGNRQITTEELGQRLIENLIRKGKKAEGELEEFKGMSDDEKKAYCTKFLEDTGAIVITSDEIDTDTDTPILELNQKSA